MEGDEFLVDTDSIPAMATSRQVPGKKRAMTRRQDR
jgi:hypothetical protein